MGQLESVQVHRLLSEERADRSTRTSSPQAPSPSWPKRRSSTCTALASFRAKEHPKDDAKRTRTLHRHQRQSIEAALENDSYVLTTGTGSEGPRHPGR
ncbi:hypothetical protein [Actinomadura latina]|uniref:hypothetical protein n=1 Tax=Actinomadura latina TaxID=163603 RepID=UPI0014709CF8|nr:hypothetical protein [Actinomadura latina]